MPKNILVFELQRPHPSIPWGFCIQGGKDIGVSVKVANVKRATPASRAGIHKMDYLNSINGRPVFNMSHSECAREIKNCGQQMVLECERGDHIVPSFEEIFPGLRGDDDMDTCKRKKFIGDEYYRDAMENHGLGHLPQPDNFTTVGNSLGIEVNQYNCPIEAYSTNTIDEMRDMKEKGGLDLAGKLPVKPADKFKFDPAKSNAYKLIQQDEAGRST